MQVMRLRALAVTLFATSLAYGQRSAIKDDVTSTTVLLNWARLRK